MMSRETSDNEQRLNSEYRIRKQKLHQLRRDGNAFPNDFRRDCTSDRLHQLYDEFSTETLSAHHITVSVAGRMMTRRAMGKASFITLQDMGGGYSYMSPLSVLATNNMNATSKCSIRGIS